MSKNIDWKNLGFNYLDVGSYVKVEYKNGSWGDIIECKEPFINIHVASTCLHYGQACFEGVKAFTQKNGTIATFRPDENALRLRASAERLVMEAPSVDLFIEASNAALKLSKDYIPPYGTGASMYIRPLLIGTSPMIGVNPSEEYELYILTMPVGPYYKDGFLPISAYIQENYDRAAPKGVGYVKAGGNYAAGMKANREAKSKGYPICLFLDSAEHKYIDEFGTSNFIGITADNKYVTPKSSSILPSIINKSLQTLAEDFGFKVEKRPVLASELDQFIEVGACGTAAIITPINSISYKNNLFTYGDKNIAGENLTKLYNELQSVQYGEHEDKHHWMVSLV